LLGRRWHIWGRRHHILLLSLKLIMGLLLSIVTSLIHSKAGWWRHCRGWCIEILLSILWLLMHTCWRWCLDWWGRWCCNHFIHWLSFSDRHRNISSTGHDCSTVWSIACKHTFSNATMLLSSLCVLFICVTHVYRLSTEELPVHCLNSCI
jgi:hypothetical protein